jgi:mannosylglycerate hydrolase
LPSQAGLFTLASGATLHVSAVKQAEDGSGLVIRLFNPSAETEQAVFRFGVGVTEAFRCRMDESVTEALTPAADGYSFEAAVEPKKIVTFKVILANGSGE